MRVDLAVWILTSSSTLVSHRTWCPYHSKDAFINVRERVRGARWRLCLSNCLGTSLAWSRISCCAFLFSFLFSSHHFEGQLGNEDTASASGTTDRTRR